MAVDSIGDFTGRGEGAHRVQVRPGRESGMASGVGKPGFADLMKEFAQDVNDLQFQAGHAVDMLATGRAADVHQVMIAVEEASIAMDLMLEVRNKLLEGYQELIRMQV
jgi:flagellar hook-basal body complex protein FliE